MCIDFWTPSIADEKSVAKNLDWTSIGCLVYNFGVDSHSHENAQIDKRFEFSD